MSPLGEGPRASGKAGDRPPVPHDDTLATQLAITGIVVVGFATLVVWLGAQTAALVFGGDTLRVSFGESAHALLALPRNLTEPARAWSPLARSRLPGATAYWMSTGIVGLVVVALAVSGILAFQHWRTRTTDSLGVRPHAGFARGRDLRRLAVPAPQPGRLTLGYSRRQLVAAEPQVSLAVIGPTGCGKTAGFAIPALLEWRGPVIATSVKADLIDATVAHRRARGRVWIYDPTGSSGSKTADWSPLTACTTWAGAMRVAAWLCEAAQPRTDSVTDGDYWYTQARKGLAPYVHAAALTGQTMRDVVRWVDIQEETEIQSILRRDAGVDECLQRLLASDAASLRREELRSGVEHTEVELVRQQLKDVDTRHGSWALQPLVRWPAEQHRLLTERVAHALEQRLRAELLEEAMTATRGTGQLDPLIAAESLWQKEARLRGSVFATMENILAGYADPGVGRADENHDTTSDALDLAAWLEGDNTIYVVAAAHEQARLRPVLTVLVQQAIRSAYERANARGGTLEHSCLVLLDEAGNIAPLRDLPGYASTSRSHGITFVSIWQDLAQIKAIYRDRAQTVLNNHRGKLFGTGIADDATLEYVSRLIGDERRTEINLSGDLHGTRRSVTEHVTYRRAAPADVLRRIRPNEAVLVYGSELPVHVRLRPWFSRTRMSRLGFGTRLSEV